MEVVGLDGKSYRWRPELYNDEREDSSSNHKRARSLIRELFPLLVLNEEVQLVGVPCKLFIDIYVHSIRMAVEIHGEQHYKYNSFFFSSAKDFRKAQQRDRMKKEWCELNNLDFVELPYNETNEQWKERINGRGQTV